MKKISVILLLLTATLTIVLAQTNYDLYKMKNVGEADIVLNTLNSELKLSETQLAELHELLYGSMKGQAELFQKPENTSAEMSEGILRRQTGHIEGNLKEMIGEDKFKQYLKFKPAIEQKVQLAQQTK